MISVESTAQKEGDRTKRTSNQAQTRNLHSTSYRSHHLMLWEMKDLRLGPIARG